MKRCEGLFMAEAFYLRVTLEPHHKHSGSTTGGTILFLAEVPMALEKHSTSNPDEEAGLLREAERLAEWLTPIAMTGRPRQEGEDVMRASFHAIPEPPEDILECSADAEKDGVRVWLLGTNVE